MAIERTQIDFKRPPEEWGGQLYRLLDRVIQEFNGQIEPAISDLEDRVKNNEGSIENLGNTIR